MGTKSGELREFLMTTIEQVRDGTCDPGKAKAIAALAGQINASLQVEVSARIQQIKWQEGVENALGHMPLGDEDDGLLVSEQ